MKRALVYCRADPSSGDDLAKRRWAAEEWCRQRGWEPTSYSDSAAGHRPPLQLSSGNQLIRPGLSRLLSAAESRDVCAVAASTPGAMAVDTDLQDRIVDYLSQLGFREERSGDGPGPCYIRADGDTPS